MLLDQTIDQPLIVVSLMKVRVPLAILIPGSLDLLFMSWKNSDLGQQDQQNNGEEACPMSAWKKAMCNGLGCLMTLETYVTRAVRLQRGWYKWAS